MTISIPCPKCSAVLKLRDSSLLGKTGKCPKCEHRFVLRDPDEVEMELVEAPAPRSQRDSSGPKVGTGAQWVPDTPEPESTPLSFGAPEVGSLNRLRRKRRKRSLPQKIAMLAGVVILGVAGVWGWKTFAPALAEPEVVAAKKAKPHKQAVPDEPSETDQVAAAEKSGEPEFGRPTHGKPIDLLWIPSGARIIISLRPADLWKAGNLGEGEFIAGLGPLGAWMATSMEQFLMAKPAEIDEALICLIPGARGTPPDVAAVVHRTAVDASEVPKPTDGGIEELLTKTDRDLHFTAVCVPADLKIHGEFLVPPNAQTFLQNVADWISSDDEAEAVAWSFHLSKEKFYTQLMARNSAVTKAHQLAKSFKSRLAMTPRRILETIEMMNPPQAGPRKVIGRVPAMSKVVQLGTHIETGNRLVSLSFEGPERAGPNLGLGTLLAWDESTRTNFTASPGGGTTVANNAEKKPLKELLRSKIDIDFRRLPLQDAFNYIAGEAKFEIIVDGDALKAAGYTKNMPQTFKDDGITASAALAKIITVGKYDKMCYVIDEKNSTVTVMTLQKAEDSKLTVYQMK